MVQHLVSNSALSAHNISQLARCQRCIFTGNRMSTCDCSGTGAQRETLEEGERRYAQMPASLAAALLPFQVRQCAVLRDSMRFTCIGC